MLLINDVLVTEDIYKEQFVCDISACKGACCWEGHYGAPLEDDEIDIIEKELESISQVLSDEAKENIKSLGFHTYSKSLKLNTTGLLKDARCVFLNMENGIAKCGIEKAYEMGYTKFRKPISCHLYPIRIKKQTESGLEVMKYDRWSICRAACEKGRSQGVLLFEFVKDAIIRKYGQEFYNQLKDMASRF